MAGCHPADRPGIVDGGNAVTPSRHVSSCSGHVDSGCCGYRCSNAEPRVLAGSPATDSAETEVTVPTMSTQPNDMQREALSVMMHRAFREIRVLGWQGKGQQVADLADAFHNLPMEMYGLETWNPAVFRQILLDYQRKYGRDRVRDCEYVAMLDAIYPPLFLYARGRPSGRCLILAKLLCEVTGRQDAIATAERLFDCQHRPENPAVLPIADPTRIGELQDACQQFGIVIEIGVKGEP